MQERAHVYSHVQSPHRTSHRRRDRRSCRRDRPAQAGIQATVFEAYPTLAEGIGGGLALAPNGLAALGIIGADDAVRALATPITGTVMAVGGKPAGCPAWRAWSHSRSSAAATCTGSCTPGGRVGCPLRVRQAPGRVDEAPDSVTARFDDGSAATADVLIGADGVRSTVRTLIDPEAPGAGYTGLLGFQGYVDASPGLDPDLAS